MLIVPTYNERENIAPLVAAVRQAAGSEPILFADDNSPDGTGGEIRRLQAGDPHIHLLARPGKGGYGPACRAAIQKVLGENLDDHLIQFDADLSHPPELLPVMLKLLRENEVVVGSRYMAGGGTQNWSWPRRTLSRGANLYARLFTGVPVHDVTAGFVGYRAEALRRIDLDGIQSNGYAFLMEMKFKLYRAGARFAEFPITFSERRSGRSKFNRAIAVEGAKFPLRAWRARIGA